MLLRRLKRFGYVSVLIDCSGCDLFRMLCLPKQFVHHSLRPLRKCNNLSGRGHLYKLLDLWPPNSPDLNPTDYKIWGIIIFCNESIRQSAGLKDLMQRQIDAWAK